MSIITSNSSSEKLLLNSVKNFFTDFSISKLLSRCNCNKLKGVPVMVLFTYIFSKMFNNRSFYMQLKTGSFKENFSKNTYYRFLENTKANWLRFTTLLSADIINTKIRKLTSDEGCFIIDDTLYGRSSHKKTELVSKVFDHNSGTFKIGYRLMTLGWSDGRSFVPINSALLASSDPKNVYCESRKFDKRSLAGKRRIMAQSKGTDVCIELLKYALKSKHKAKYVLFDTWFSNPCTLARIKHMDLDCIAMLKSKAKTRYLYNGKLLTLKEIYSSCKKRPGNSRYKLSVKVKLNTQEDVEAKIVFVKNKNNRKEWVAIICTEVSLSEDEIQRIYGKRWSIEVFFKTCKSLLGLCNEYHGLSYDALTAHVAFVFARYMLITLEQRNNKDERTLGELFYLMFDEMADISLAEAIKLITEAMFNSVKEIVSLSEEQLLNLIGKFMDKLPKFYSSQLLGKNVS